MFYISAMDLLGNDRPLNVTERKKLKQRRSNLVDCLNISNLLTLLEEISVLNRRHVCWINMFIQNELEHKDRFIEIIQRRSFAHYQQFVECLRLTEQSHLACSLEDDGGLITQYCFQLGFSLDSFVGAFFGLIWLP